MEQLQALPGPFAAAGRPGECGIVLGQVLDVESHPVDQGKQLLQAVRVAAARVQADLETHLFHFRDRPGERILEGGFAATEDHGVEQPLAQGQHFQQGLPVEQLGTAGVEQVGIVAVAAAPGAALAEDHRGQLAGVVDGGERHEAADAHGSGVRAPVFIDGTAANASLHARVGHPWPPTSQRRKPEPFFVFSGPWIPRTPAAPGARTACRD